MVLIVICLEEYRPCVLGDGCWCPCMCALQVPASCGAAEVFPWPLGFPLALLLQLDSWSFHASSDTVYAWLLSGISGPPVGGDRLMATASSWRTVQEGIALILHSSSWSCHFVVSPFVPVTPVLGSIPFLILQASSYVPWIKYGAHAGKADFRSQCFQLES